MSLGFDCGTYNLVAARRNDDNSIAFRREVNAFIEMPLANGFVFNMMKNAGVPLIERKEAGLCYALGEAAINLAYAITSIELKRPMKDGCLNPKEKYAQQIMSIMIHSMLNPLKFKKEVLYYSVPANAVNMETDADYHSKVLEAMFRAFEDDNGNKVDARPINEGLAIIYSELAHKAYTGIGVSCGSGMVNVCYSMFGAPIFEFSIVNSGDWIDKQAAKATGESPTFINREKMKVDLEKDSNELVQRAIKAQYELMIQKTVAGIKNGLESLGGKAHAEHPVDVIVAGGTSSPNGFDKLFSKAMSQAHLPIEIGDVIRPNDPLYTVAKGCLVASENARMN